MFVYGYLYAKNFVYLIVLSFVMTGFFLSCYNPDANKQVFTSDEEVIEFLSQVSDLKQQGRDEAANNLLESKNINTQWVFEYGVHLGVIGKEKEQSQVLELLSEIH